MNDGSGGVPQCAAAGRISSLQQPLLLMGHQMQYLQHGPPPPPPPPLVMPAAGDPLPVYANRFAYRSRNTRRSLRKRLQQKREWGAAVAREAAVMRGLHAQVRSLETQQSVLRHRLSRMQAVCQEMHGVLADTRRLLVQQGVPGI